MAYEFFEPFPDIRQIRALFVKELAPFPKISLEYKRSIANPSTFSFLNLVSMAGHFRADWDPYVYKSTLHKFQADEKTRIEEDGIKKQKYLAEIKALEMQARETSGPAKETLEKRIANMKDHEIYQFAKPGKKPQMFDNRFLAFEADVDNRFSNEDSVKFKYGNSGLLEANFTLRNLVDKGVLTQDLSAFKRNVYDIMKTKELYVNLTKELGKSSLKTINLQLKSKTSAEHLSLTITNNVNKVEKIEKVEGIDRPVIKEKVTSNYKLIYNCPLNENLKIKTTFFDNFLANNQLEVKLRKNIFGKLNFQNYYAMKFSFNTETVHSKERTAENKVNYKFQNALINILKPEKAVFAFTYDINSSLEHRFRPYVGLVVHNVFNNKCTSLNLGYLHNMDFTTRNLDGTISGLRANYSIFYKYEDFISWLKKENIISDNKPTAAGKPSAPSAGKEFLSLGSEIVYFFDKNDYLHSCTAKVLVTDSAVRFHKNLLFKKWGDYFNYLNVAFKFNIEKENNKFAYRSGINVEIL